MPSWITLDHLCKNCGNLQTEIHDRADIQDNVYCNECHTDAAVRVPGAFVSTAKLSFSIPDGTTKRFDGVRRKQAVKRWLQDAKGRGDYAEVKRARAEMKKLDSKEK